MRLQTTTRHCLICGIERETPEPLLEGFARAPELIADALAHATAAGHAGWTPAEVVSHLADTEMNFGARIRQVLAEDEPLLTSYDQERWARALGYTRRDPALALETFGVCRAASIELLRAARPADWQRAYVQTPEGWRPGDAAAPTRRTLDDLVRHRADHDLQHLRQITG